MISLAAAGALASLGLGVAALMFPARIAAMVGISPLGGPGLAEVRATYGGFFVGIGAVCLVLDNRAAFATAAAGWLGAAVARLFSMARDRRELARNAAGLVVEAGIGLLLLTGALPGGL